MYVSQNLPGNEGDEPYRQNNHIKCTVRKASWEAEDKGDKEQEEIPRNTKPLLKMYRQQIKEVAEQSSPTHVERGESQAGPLRGIRERNIGANFALEVSMGHNFHRRTLQVKSCRSYRQADRHSGG